MTILRLICALALFYVALAETIRGVPKPNLELGDVQQGDILNAMERFTRALSKGASGLQLPDNFKNADGSFISIPHNVEVVNEAEEKRKLAAPTAPTKCDGSEPSTVTVDKTKLNFNIKTNPSFSPIPTTVTGFANLISSVKTAITDDKTSVCMFINVDVGKQGLNWDTTGDKVTTASIDVGDADKFKATCKDCYAVMGGTLTYKAECTIHSSKPLESVCTVKMFVGGGVKFNVDLAITKLALADDTLSKAIVSGTKTQVFYDPSTTISISVKPTLSVGILGKAESTGKLGIKTSLDSTASMGATFATPSGNLDVGFAGDIKLVSPSITSDLKMDTYDVTLSIVPQLEWTIGAGQMVTATYIGASSAVAATGLAVEIIVPNPMSFNWQFTKTASKVSSKASATVGFAVTSMYAYMALNYYYTGSKATAANPLPLYDYSKWPDSYTTAPCLEYKWKLYSSDKAATAVALGTEVSAAVSLLTPSTAPAPAPAPAAAKEASSGGSKAGVIVGSIFGALALGGGGYYFYMIYMKKQNLAAASNNGLGLNKI